MSCCFCRLFFVAILVVAFFFSSFILWKRFQFPCLWTKRSTCMCMLIEQRLVCIGTLVSMLEPLNSNCLSLRFYASMHRLLLVCTLWNPLCLFLMQTKSFSLAWKSKKKIWNIFTNLFINHKIWAKHELWKRNLFHPRDLINTFLKHFLKPKRKLKRQFYLKRESQTYQPL